MPPFNPSRIETMPACVSIAAFLRHAASLAVAGLPGLLLAGVAHAQVDPGKSTVSAISKQMNVPVEGSFRKFSAEIHFDPASLATSSARVDVDTGSYDLGQEDYNAQVRGKDWFDSAAFPKASFVSSAIRPVSGENYSLAGKLTIKGKTIDVTVPVRVHSDGTTRTFDGTVPISRLQFGIGQNEWKDTSVVADPIQIEFHIVATGS
jgi:polyisoprenoid-binding protein YceI